MTKYLTKLLLITVFLLSTIHHPLFTAVKIHPNAGTTSAAFLKLGIGSRAIGMGEAFVGISDDITALYWNPAGLAQLDKNEVHFTHNESIEKINHDFIGYARLLPEGIIAAAIYGLTMPNDIERRSGLNEDDPFSPLTSVEGYFGAQDLAVHVSYSKWIRKNIAGGASVKIIKQEIDNYSAYGIAFDAGAMYKCTYKNIPLSLGAVIQNAGTKIKFRDKGYFPPFNIKIGGACDINKKLTAAVDLNKPIDNYLFISLGGEYKANEMFILRSGYKYRLNGLELGGMSGFSAGIGFKFKAKNADFRFDYAFSPSGVLGNSHRFSINSFFGTRPAAKPKTPKAKKEKKKKVKKPKKEKKTKEAKKEPVSPVFDGYTIYPATVESKTKLANGRTSINEITIKCPESDVYLIQGSARGHESRAFNVQVAEKLVSSTTYKSFRFKTNFPLQIFNATYKLRVPSVLENTVVETEEKQPIKIEKIGGDDKYIQYKFNLNSLESFVVHGSSKPFVIQKSTVIVPSPVQPEGYEINKSTTAPADKQ